MQKKVLSEIALYSGKVIMPKHYDIERSKIKADILTSQLENKTVSSNPFDYSFFDYKIEHSRPLDMLHTYIREQHLLHYKRNLLPVLNFGNILQHGEQSFSRRCLDETMYRESPDFVMVYGVDVYPDSANIVIEYDDNRRVNATWHIPINNNEYVIFPTTQRFFITGNTSHSTNVFLLTTFEYV